MGGQSRDVEAGRRLRMAVPRRYKTAVYVHVEYMSEFVRTLEESGNQMFSHAEAALWPAETAAEKRIRSLSTPWSHAHSLCCSCDTPNRRR